MSRLIQDARQSRALRALLGLTLASSGFAFAAFLFGCPQSQIDIDFGDGGTSSAGDGQVVPTGCDLTKDPKDSPACIDDSIALFVSLAGKDTNAGTKAAPLQTIKAALAKVDAQHNRVYVCEGTYPEKVELSATATASLFGGFACADWTDSGKVVKIAPNGHGSVISIQGVASPITIADLEIDAPNAELSGESSIAAFVSNSGGVTFSNDVVSAGSAAKGTDGTLIEYLYSTDNAGNSASGGTGGPAKTVICQSGVTVGGKGGDNGFPGDPGQPDIDGGTGGAGGTGTVCTTGVGVDGTPGLPGANGSGAINVGSIDQTGWTPSTGSQGGTGGTGQGGGGGAGFTGNGGGSGGAGGCGGASGAPGFGGGGSIGILIFGSPVTISKSQITTSTAGNGGAGIAGQPGQTPGGAHGNGAGTACQGGNGGAGGAGGPTGGGAGGVSIGVFYKNTNAPVIDADTKFNGPTSGGTKGTGGAPGANDGVDGIAGTVVENK